MGIDYVRMRLKPRIPRARLLALIETQAAAFHACGFSQPAWLKPYDPPSVSEDDSVFQHYGAASRTLWSYLDVDEWYDGMDFYASFRVYPITHNDIFPIEWQFAAYRTYLPDQLPTQLANWIMYLDAVRQEDYQAYLLRRYVYELSLELSRGWIYLCERAELSRTRTNVWTQKPAFMEIRDIVDRFPPPPLHPAPLWSYWQHKTDCDQSEIEQQYTELEQYKQTLANLTREWDRHVPSRWKQPAYICTHLENFPTFLAQANDSWLEEFCAWVGRCCEENMGLFLHY